MSKFQYMFEKLKMRIISQPFLGFKLILLGFVVIFLGFITRAIFGEGLGLVVQGAGLVIVIGGGILHNIIIFSDNPRWMNVVTLILFICFILFLLLNHN